MTYSGIRIAVPAKAEVGTRERSVRARAVF